MKGCLSILLLLMVTGTICAAEPTTLPSDVDDYVQDRDLCDHFRREVPYDDDRKTFINQNIKVLCSGTDAALAKLKAKYASQSAILTLLNKYEVKIEPILSN